MEDLDGMIDTIKQLEEEIKELKRENEDLSKKIKEAISILKR